jgi:hypothetical protein
MPEPDAGRLVFRQIVLDMKVIFGKSPHVLLAVSPGWIASLTASNQGREVRRLELRDGSASEVFRQSLHLFATSELDEFI